MDKFIVALIAVVAVLALQASRAADNDRNFQLYSISSRDCGRGTVDDRLACLNAEVSEIKKILDGHEARIVPLQR